MSLESLKLSKQLLNALTEAGYEKPLPMQAKAMSRLLGGQEIIGIGPEGSGKSTSVVLCVLMRLKFAHEKAPRALVLAPDKEKVLSLVEQFNKLGASSNLRILGVHAQGGIDGQRETISDGIDILVGTPDRVLALYLKSGLNLNKLQQFILDDSELIIKQGLQSQVHQIALSLPKCQRIAFTEVVHEKFQRLADGFMKFPTLIEAVEESDAILETLPLFLYRVPNYKTKQNLLNLLMSDADTYSKVLIFANTKVTAQNLYKSLDKRYHQEVALLKPSIYGHQGVQSVAEFLQTPSLRLLVASNEIEQFMQLDGHSHIIHYDLPALKDLVIPRITRSNFEKTPLPESITFSTDIELTLVNKIEIQVGQKMQVLAHPAGLVVEGTRKRKTAEEGDAIEIEKSKVSNQGAFHEKKATNAKDYNWGWKEKNKLFGKKYKRIKKS